MQKRSVQGATAALVLVLCCAEGSTAPYPTEFGDEVEARGYLPQDLPLRPVRDRAHEHHGLSAGVRRLRGGSWLSASAVAGALSGKVVYLSPGHGWVHGASQGWVTQRPNTHGVVEDMSNGDGVAQFLVPYLLAAGAQVVPVREIDPNPNLVIVDDSDGSAAPQRGRYFESGDASVFSDSTLPGWGHPPLPLTGTVNPFALGNNRLMASSPTETARATFVLAVPENGLYYVYVAHSMYSARASDAELIVAHPGGQTTFLVDQRRHGGTWVLLGRFYFEAGMDEQRGAIIVTNRSQDAGSNVSVDAVRIGGGKGLIDRGGGISGQPRADECSRYHAQFSGAPPTVFDASSGEDRTDDISTRSRFADWLHAPGEPAVFVSHHTNAFNGAARGTETYVYGPNPPNGSMSPSQTVVELGAVQLAEAVQGELIGDLRAAVDPSWTDRKVRSAYFGELNPSYQDEMAAILIETAFHDQADDAAQLKDARFRRVVARAIYKGIVRYFAAREGGAVHLLPEPPRAMVARSTAANELTVAFEPPPLDAIYGDPATSYRVYRSANGRSFDEGTDTAGALSLRLRDVPPGEVVYLRVTAVNDGGESLPSQTCAVRPGELPRALLVGGFDRIDPELNIRRTYPRVATVDRLLLDRMNDGSYLADHGAALAATGMAFDCAVHDAVGAGAVRLEDYALVLWQGGRGIAADRALTDASRDALAAAGRAGVSLVLSGSFIGRSLAAGNEADATLLELLGAKFTAVTDPQLRIAPAAEGSLAGLADWDLSGHDELPYDPGALDELEASKSSARVAARYATAAGAMVELREGSRCSALLGFPLEAVRPPERRAELLRRLLDYCGMQVPAQPDGGPPAQPDAGATHPDGGPPELESAGGCSCRAAGGDALPAGAAMALLALLLLTVRRMRRSQRDRARRERGAAAAGED